MAIFFVIGFALWYLQEQEARRVFHLVGHDYLSNRHFPVTTPGYAVKTAFVISGVLLVCGMFSHLKQRTSGTVAR
jgi:hypothetical protein